MEMCIHTLLFCCFHVDDASPPVGFLPVSRTVKSYSRKSLNLCHFLLHPFHGHIIERSNHQRCLREGSERYARAQSNIFFINHAPLLDGGTLLRDRLRKLLIDRQIPFIPITTDVDPLRVLGRGVFGCVELIRYQKKLYARKRPLQSTRDQRNSILEEGIKLTDIAQYHPNIQRLHLIDLHCYGLVIDYCSNGALDVFVKEKSSEYSLVDAINWGCQLADALSFLHSKKIGNCERRMQHHSRSLPLFYFSSPRCENAKYPTQRQLSDAGLDWLRHGHPDRKKLDDQQCRNAK